jgi:hypothetical protein
MRASWLALVVLVAVGACVGLGPSAQADSLPAFRLTVDRHVLHSGQSVTATATTTTRCDWLLEWNGDRHVEHARTSTATWTAPQVSRPTMIPVHATCFYASGAARPDAAPRATGPGQRVAVTVPPSWRRTLVVTVLPRGSEVSAPGTVGGAGHPGGGLPGTGGPALWILFAGLGAVFVGSATVRSSPRRLAG